MGFGSLAPSKTQGFWAPWGAGRLGHGSIPILPLMSTSPVVGNLEDRKIVVSTNKH